MTSQSITEARTPQASSNTTDYVYGFYEAEKAIRRQRRCAVNHMHLEYFLKVMEGKETEERERDRETEREREMKREKVRGKERKRKREQAEL